MITLILGGQASGKSDYALKLLKQKPAPGLMLVTGKAKDFAFRKQILKHKRERSNSLAVLETDLDLPEALTTASKNYKSLLVDSLDFWLFSCLEAGRLKERQTTLTAQLQQMQTTEVILVSCEVGLGGICANVDLHNFIRAAGRMNQQIAAIADQVLLIVAGQAIVVKS